MSVTLTNVRCEGCGASLSPAIDPELPHAVEACSCGHINHFFRGEDGVVEQVSNRVQAVGHAVSSEDMLREMARPDVLGAALTECSAAFAGVSSHGRAREVIEALRNGHLEVDAATRVRLSNIMGYT